MRAVIVCLAVATGSLAGCSFAAVEARAPHDPSQAAGREARAHIPDVRRVDLAEAVKALRDAGFTVDMSSLSRFERQYGKQLISGYYQSHPRVVVVDYAVEGGTVSIKQVECRRRTRC
jgi:hypothetical protein